MFALNVIPIRAAMIVCFAALTALPVRAMEHITLRSGFTVDCDRHEIVGDHVRLYTGKGSDYQEVSFLQVANIEFLPDAPKSVAPTLAAAPPKPIVLSRAAFIPLEIAYPVAHFAKMQSAVPQPSEFDFHDLISRAGAEHNIDVELLASVIHAESGYRPTAVSRAGARGLMQLMPSTARNFGAHDLFKAEENIAAGTAFLDDLLKRYHDNLALALAAYNAGPGAVERYHGVPPFRQTRDYVTRVINEFYRRKIALGTRAGTAAVETAAHSPVKPLEAAALTLASGPLPTP